MYKISVRLFYICEDLSAALELFLCLWVCFCNYVALPVTMEPFLLLWSSSCCCGALLSYGALPVAMELICNYGAEPVSVELFLNYGALCVVMEFSL